MQTRDQDDRVVSAPQRHTNERFTRNAIRLTIFVGRRLVQLVVVIVLLLFATSLLVRVVPGDPATAILGARATPETLASLRESLGLNRSVVEQLADQIWRLIQGDLGTSLRTGQPVAATVASALPITMALVCTAIVFALILSLPLGLLPALGLGMRAKRVLRISMVVLIAVPSFLIGIYLLQLFAVQLRLAPVGGWSSEWPAVLSYVWLPALALGIFLTPLLVRTLERAASQAMNEDFVEAARARGLSKTKVVLRHVLPNTLLPVITLVGFSMAAMIGGAVIIESVFGIPGLGSTIITAVGQRDYPTIVGVTIFTGILTVVISMATEILYSVADPRLRIR